MSNQPNDCAACDNQIQPGESILEVKVAFGTMNSMVVATQHPGGKFVHLGCVKS